jgi:polyisoprenoid-binding protein YceI
MSERLTTIVDGIEVPVPGTFVFDPNHTNVGFWGRHMMITKVRGRFERFAGGFTVAEKVDESTVWVDIEAASLTTASDKRDPNLRGPDFLDAENHPTITYRSTSLSHIGGRWRMVGDLTIKGISKPIEMDVEFVGAGKDPYGRVKAAFSAEGDLRREDWDMSWNQALESGGVLVGPVARLEIEAQGVLQVE